MSMCRVFSCVVGRVYLLWPVCSLGKTLLAFVLLHSVLQGQICLVFLDFLLLHSSLLEWKGHLFWVLVLKALVVLHKTINFSFFSITGWGIGLDYCDIEWFALKTNRDHSVFLRLHPSTAFWTLVDHDGFSISSKGFLPIVVDNRDSKPEVWFHFDHGRYHRNKRKF